VFSVRSVFRRTLERTEPISNRGASGNRSSIDGMTRRMAIWAVAIIGGTIVVLAIVAGVGSRTSVLRRLVVETLAERLESEVELSAFSVDLLPTVRVSGEGLVVRHKGRRDVPPLISMRSFRLETGLSGLLRRPRRFRFLRMDGLQIAIPPGGVNAGGAPRSATPGANTPLGPSPIVIDRLEAHDASLMLVPRRADKDPRVFAIRKLDLQSVGIAERIPFEAELTNPIPRGNISTKGTFGPWQRDEPGATPLDGKYTFAHADMSTIKGLGGTLDSTGNFSGQLERIQVTGETRSSDFSLDIARHPMPLTTTFYAVVDGTNGDTYLNTVSAKLGETPLTTKGAITGTRGVKGRTVTLHVEADKGRIEDFLQLSVKSKQPLMTGAIGLTADLTIPAGDADVVEKLLLDGRFDIRSARFTDPSVQSKITGMSHRARGEDADEPKASVVSDLRGRFNLKRSLLALSGLTFQIPGATVRLDGTYGLRSEELQFDGTLRMDATISEAAGGGVKSMVLKAVDPLFRRGKAGAVVPIRVRGTREQPKFGLDVGRIFSRD
jgi:AsmA-like C-terminal region